MPEPGIGGRHRSFVGIADRVRHHAGRTPDAPAAIFGGRTLTYSELSWRMEAFARGLLARGVRRGDRVAALSTPRPEYLLTFLGAARIGAVWVGLNPVQTVPEQLHILGDCRPKLLFAFRHLRGLDMQPLLRCVAASCPFVESIVRLEQDERHSSQGCDAFLNGGDALDGRAVSSLPPIRGRVAILDEAGRGLPPGEPGEIAVRGPCLMLGYWNDPAATAQAIDREGWLHSGDLGVMSPEGVLSLVGRRKEMFKSGGYSISPREIELAIEAHPEVEAAAVVPVPDELYQEVGHAFVLPRPGAELREEDLRQWCSQRLANYKRPKLIHLCERLPMLSIGKVDKAALRQRALAGTPPRRSGTL